jgi:hypothetical protein
MRITRSPDLPAVVLVKSHGVGTLVIPEGLSPHEVLELASLVLSASEYEELWHAVEPAADHGADAGIPRFLAPPRVPRAFRP